MYFYFLEVLLVGLLPLYRVVVGGQLFACGLLAGSCRIALRREELLIRDHIVLTREHCCSCWYSSFAGGHHVGKKRLVVFVSLFLSLMADNGRSRPSWVVMTSVIFNI